MQSSLPKRWEQGSRESKVSLPSPSLLFGAVKQCNRDLNKGLDGAHTSISQLTYGSRL